MNKETLKKIFNTSYQSKDWKDFLKELFRNLDSNYFQTPRNLKDGSLMKHKGVEKILEFGDIKLADGKTIKFYEVVLTEDLQVTKNRVGLRNIISSEVIPGYIDGAIITYHNHNAKDWRFTFISKSLYWDEENKEVKTETQPRRYTYLLGKNETVRTAVNQFELLFNQAQNEGLTIVDFLKAFSVEKLSKEFFKSYKYHYNAIVNYLEASDNYYKYFNKNEKNIRDFVKKMMGRIVFIYFLQKKKWLGATSLQYTDGNIDFIDDFWEKAPKTNSFYKDHLTRLFFMGLNLQRKNDDFELPNGKVVKVPFLNGGLFEPDNEINKGDFPIIPDSLFKDLFAFFSSYNFTIDESALDEREIGIDPEMLGHIFENLLEDNKDKGAFYTPKEIVQFMTQESLIEYINASFERNDVELGEVDKQAILNLVRHKVGIDENEMPTHEQLVDLHKQVKFLQKYGQQLNTILDEVKICDPAIGSGAFPMGLLNEIYHCKLAMNTSLSNDEKVNIKKHIIENSIYGVDIEKGAVDIAQLRFWLSLIIDKDKPTTLPNLEYKIVVGNSIFTTFENHFIDLDWKKSSAKASLSANLNKELKLLSQKQKEFFDSENKSPLTQEIRTIKLDIIEKQLKYLRKRTEDRSTITGNIFTSANTKRNSKQFADPIPYGILLNLIEDLRQNEKKELNFFDWKINFPEILNPLLNEGKIGFDIVIGNPPYLRVQGLRDYDTKYTDRIAKTFLSATGSFDLYGIFAEKALELTSQDGILNFIMPDKWTNAAFGKGLRSLIRNEKAAYRIISFGDFQVFNASTYTALQWFKRDSDSLYYNALDHDLKSNFDIRQYLQNLTSSDFNAIPAKRLTEKQWTLTSQEIGAILNKLQKHQRNVNDVFLKIFQGIATSKDSVYFLYKCSETDGIVTGYSKELDAQVQVERGLVKPLLKGDDVHRYKNLITDKFVIFPYIIENGSGKAISEKYLKKTYPLGYQYILLCKEAINSREKGRLANDKAWFKYIYPKSLTLFDKQKLIAPDISQGGNFAYDKKGEFYSTTTNYGYIKKKEIQESYKFFMALLNSNLMWWYLINTGTPLANNYFRYKPDYVKPFALPELKHTKDERAFVFIVNMLLFLHKSKTPSINGEAQRDIIKRLEELLDFMVYELYFNDDFQENGITLISKINKYKKQSWKSQNRSQKEDSIYRFYKQLINPENELKIAISEVPKKITFIKDIVKSNPNA